MQLLIPLWGIHFYCILDHISMFPRPSQQTLKDISKPKQADVLFLTGYIPFRSYQDPPVVMVEFSFPSL